jgi:hypothetical protein
MKFRSSLGPTFAPWTRRDALSRDAVLQRLRAKGVPIDQIIAEHDHVEIVSDDLAYTIAAWNNEPDRVIELPR